jgi:hypothetical protein
MSLRYGLQNLIPAGGQVLALALFVVSPIVCAQTSEAPKVPTIAVMPLQAKGVSATDADVISDAIATQLQQSGPPVSGKMTPSYP